MYVKVPQYYAAGLRQEAQKLVQRERRKITHSVYHDWEEVRKTAIILLRHMGISVENDKDKAQK